MRSEYDIRGGIRGKYFKQYQQVTSITSVVTGAASIVAQSTARAGSGETITRIVSYPPPAPSPKIQIGGQLTEAHAG
jgi:hypothetical protein